MQPRYRTSLLPALLCALAVVLCVVAANPVAEIGLNDDGSYIQSALALARTGHIQYNGGSTAMLGWQLYLGALFIRLFGFSFTIVRVSGLLVTIACVLLLHRIYLRFGLSPVNAVLATLTVVLSPLFLSLSFSFMSDIPGFFAILLCLYLCLRAEQATTDRNAALWLMSAALTNAFAGCVRQIAWLGVIVMVPSVAWLLRKRRHVLVTAALSCIVAFVVVLILMFWFKHQPYVLNEPLLPRSEGAAARTAKERLSSVAAAVFTTLLFCIPVCLAFLPKLTSLTPSRKLLAAGSASLLVLIAAFKTVRRHLPVTPFVGNIVGPRGLPDLFVLPGFQPEILSYTIRGLLDFTILAAIAATILVCTQIRPSPAPGSVPGVSSRTFFYLLAPFAIADTLLTITRFTIFDRYLPPLIAVLVLWFARLYQNRFGDLSLATHLSIALMAFVSTVAMHDGFAYERARLAAIDALRAAGVPRNQIRGGFEYDAWTQVEETGYVDDPRISVPAGAYHPLPPSQLPDECRFFFDERTPSVVGRYGITYSLLSCYRPAPFAPVAYRTWLPPHNHQLFIEQLRQP